MRRGRYKRSTLFTGRRSLPIKIALGVILLIVLLVIIIPSGGSVQTADVDAVRERGILRVLVSSESNGFYSGDGNGLEGAVIKNIGEEIFGTDFDPKTDIEYIQTSSSFMDSYFSDASADIAVMQCPQGLYPTKYSYSEPYYTDTCLLVYGSRLAEEPQIKDASVGVITGSICEKRINSYTEKNKISVTLVKYPTYETMLNALRNGELTICVLPGMAYRRYSSAYSLQVHTEQLAKIGYSVVCNKENAGMAEIADKVIKEMKSSGETDTLIRRYIGG